AWPQPLEKLGNIGTFLKSCFHQAGQPYPDWTPGELPAAKNNLVETPKTSVVVLKKKVKIKRIP
ncbi:hypothetical protein scyTo_0019838, partial [Scyliorhinus torazame]|nr:hypothetical protein [Scyliorhinus torazame]